MIGNELTPKFVKAHAISGSTPTGATDAIRWMHKLLYEFWGFCVNGSNDLIVPGGFANSGVLMPAGWQSGSAVLLASGSDGTTFSGQSVFQAPSINWTSGSMAGKWLVMWKSSSQSTEDSVYPITQVINSSSIRIDVNAAGSPNPSNLKPSLTDRSNIRFRVVDLNAATFLSGYTADADGLVVVFRGASLVNSGQLSSQVRTRIRTTIGSNLPNVGLTLSPLGTWTPASSSGFFTDGSSEINAAVGSVGWTSNALLSGTGHVSLIGAQDFIICHVKGGWQAASDLSSGFHLEVPQRLYPQSFDPNPIIAMTWGTSGLTISSSIDGYGGGFKAVDPRDGSTVTLRSMIRSLTGDYFNATQYPSGAPNNYDVGRFNGMYFNALNNKFMVSDMLLGTPSTSIGSYCASRFRLRRARWVPRPVAPRFQRFGDQGEWIKVQSGVLWPWDNSTLSYNPFASGL